MSLDIPDCPDDTELKPNSDHNFVDTNSEFNRFVDDSFLTILNLPKCIKKFTKEICGDRKIVGVDQLQLTIKNFNVPPINVPTHSTKFAGATRFESSKSLTEFENITIQFKLDNNLHNYNILYKWLQMLVEPSSGAMSNIPKSDYETTFSVILLDEYEKPIGLYTFSGVFPVSIGGITLDYSTAEAVFIDFTFSFDFLSFELNPK